MEYEWISQDIPWDVTSLVVDPVTGAVAFVVNQNGASRLYLLDGTEPQEFEIPLGIVSGLQFSPDGSRLGMTLSRPDAPSDVYDLRLSDRKLTRWTFSEVGGLNPQTFVTPKRVEFRSFDGQTIPAYVYRTT